MLSYCGAPPFPDDWILRWNFDPFLLAALAVGAAAASRCTYPRTALAAVGVLFLAFVSPLCAMSVALFSARALHHIVVFAIAAPLVALSVPARRGGGLVPALMVATAILWLWHLPWLYDRALSDSAIYWCMQLSLLIAATWFWRELFAASPAQAMLATFFAMVQMGMLGALLTFAPNELYAAHIGTTLPWGMSQIADQQLAGLIMWVPGILPYGIVAAVIARRSWEQAVRAA